MEVNQFLSSLKNLEKTRDFNVFKGYSLEIFQSVLKQFGIAKKPENTLRISVVGTNGKGSVSHFISQLVIKSQVFPSVGLYTSPHLLIQNERIKLNGNSIPNEWMNSKLNTFSNTELEILKTLSYFEFFTFFAILYFKDNACNLEIYEAGLGGRLDATKITSPDIVILTKIGLDHTEILGDTEEKILLEKLKIACENTKRIYTFEQEAKLLEIASIFCRERNIELIIYPNTVNTDYLSFNKEFSLFVLNDILQKDKKQTIEKSLLESIPDISGRLQVIRRNPILVFDIGHNPSAIPFLLKSIQSIFPEEFQWEVYFGCLKDKDAKKILEILISQSSIKKIFYIVGEGWNPERILHEKIELVSEEKLKGLLVNTKNTSLVLGSFRLYPLVQ